MPHMKRWEIETPEELTGVAAEVLTLLQQTTEKARVLALHGDLGAGKTTFVQAIAKLLGVTEVVTSPTFVVMKRYVGTPETLIHIDSYRIEDIDEMRVLGFQALLQEKKTIICIEWAERIAELLPQDTLHLTFTIEGNKRQLTLKPHE